MAEADTAAPVPPTIQEKISVATVEHNELHKTLLETDYAPSALKEKSAYIITLLTQLTQKESIAAKLDYKRKREQASNQGYRDSTVRRITYNLSGKKDEFAEKAAKVERDYRETAQSHTETMRELESLQAELKEAREKLKDIEGVEKRREDSQEALDQLYDSIFEGPTPEFPEEDHAELRVAEARRAIDTLNEKLEHETKLLCLLWQVERMLNAAARAMRKAERLSEEGVDVSGEIGVRDSDQIEVLRTARLNVNDLEVLMRRACAMSGGVKSLGELEIPQTLDRSNPFRNHASREVAFLKVIKDSLRVVTDAVKISSTNKRRATRRVAAIKEEAKKAKGKLKEEKERLQEVRRGVFELVVEGLPEYHTI